MHLILVTTTLNDSFSSDSFIVSERAQCLGCPEEITENSEDIKVPLSASVSKFNSISNSTHLFILHKVGHATRQVDWSAEWG